MPSIQLVVSTRFCVRFQSTSGTRKPSSGLIFSAISEIAAASSRKSISSCVVRARLSTTAIGFRRRVGGWKRSIWRAAKAKLSRSCLKRRSTPGRRILTATSRRLTLLDHDRLVHLGDRGRRDGRAELDEVVLEPATKSLFDGRTCLGIGERRQPILQVAEIRCQLNADDVGPRGEKLAELDVTRAERRQRTRNPRLLGLSGVERPRDQPERQGRRPRQSQRKAAPSGPWVRS